MLYIQCVDTTNCNTLKEGNLYYGFPTGGKALYVSRFPREGSHMGAYQRSRFIILTEKDFIAKKSLETVSRLEKVNEVQVTEEVSPEVSLLKNEQEQPVETSVQLKPNSELEVCKEEQGGQLSIFDF